MASLNISPRGFFFILIGTISAFVHIFFVYLFVNGLNCEPLLANALAFLIAFNISYLGHRHLTFSSLKDKQLRFAHFFAVAASAGIMNEVLYFIFLQYTHVHYLIALLLVLALVASYNYLCSRYWACR